MKNDPLALQRLVAILAIALLPGCLETKTGSNGTGSVPADGKSLVAGTVVSAEPFSVGLASLDAASATLRRDETANAGASVLRLGMNLEAAGTVTGTYGAVPVVLRDGDVQSAVRGPVSAIDAAAQRFTVATLTFVVDANTLYDGVAGFPGLASGAYVEVSGLPLADLRTVLATRITQTAAPADGRLSLSARIDSLSPNGLSLAGILVPGVSSGSFSPPPPMGGRARVNGTYNAAAAAITNELVFLLPDFVPAADTKVEIEGIAINVAPNGSFVLRTPAHDYNVDSGASGATPVTAGARVRVVATASSAAALTPTSVTVVGQIVYRVSGTVSDYTSLAALRVRGEPVDLTTAVIRGGNASDIANGRRLAIVGTAGPGALRVSEATLLP